MSKINHGYCPIHDQSYNGDECLGCMAEKARAEKREERNPLCESCGVPKYNHGTSCGWPNARVQLSPTGVVMTPGHPQLGHHLHGDGWCVQALDELRTTKAIEQLVGHTESGNEQLIKKFSQRAIDAFKLPVSFHSGFILDADGQMMMEVRGWGHLQYIPDGEYLQDALGEMFAAAFNEKYPPAHVVAPFPPVTKNDEDVKPNPFLAKALQECAAKMGAAHWKALYDTLRELVYNTRPYPLSAYAPGNYWNKCYICEDRFQGDKLSAFCEDCARKVNNRYIDRLLAWVNDQLQLISVQGAYISFLTRETEKVAREMPGFEGWTMDKVEEGRQMREKIADLVNELKKYQFPSLPGGYQS